MADLTGIFTGTTIVKGQSNTITLNKTSLNALFSDAYFDVLTNWKSVIATYKSVDGQVNNVVFDTVNDLAGNFNPSALAEDSTWEIQSITILDFDGGYLKLLRGDLTTGDFDIALLAVAGNYYENDFSALLTTYESSVSDGVGGNDSVGGKLPLTFWDSGMGFSADASFTVNVGDGAGTYETDSGAGVLDTSTVVSDITIEFDVTNLILGGSAEIQPTVFITDTINGMGGTSTLGTSILSDGTFSITVYTLDLTGGNVVNNVSSVVLQLVAPFADATTSFEMDNFKIIVN